MHLRTLFVGDERQPPPTPAPPPGHHLFASGVYGIQKVKNLPFTLCFNFMLRD